jgi:hypothetical protein
MDDRAPAILAYHAAIERELELAIARKVPRPSSLTGLSYGHKVRIWSALQEVSDDLVERVAKPMLKFNDLRNAIAHGDNKREVDAVLGGLWAMPLFSRRRHGSHGQIVATQRARSIRRLRKGTGARASG